MAKIDFDAFLLITAARRGAVGGSFVVVAALGDLHGVIDDAVGQAVLLIDAPRPEPRPVATELLRFADALVSVMADHP